MFTAKILLLGSGELGKEFVISAKRYGCHVVACDSYAKAPAMQVADEAEVFSMLDADALRAAIEKHQPDFIVPEIEAIRTEVLQEFEDKGFTVVPSARAASLTMNRDRIRELAATELGLRTSKYRYAESLEEVRAGAEHTGLPCVIKPVMSSSGKGQSTVRTQEELEKAWNDAVANMRGDRKKVIVEEFVAFEYEITLLTIRGRGRRLVTRAHRAPAGARRLPGILAADADDGETARRCQGHGEEGRRQSRWLRDLRRRVLRHQGRGDLLRAVPAAARYGPRRRSCPRTCPSSICTPAPSSACRSREIRLHGPTASAVILADREADHFAIDGLAERWRSGREGDVEVRFSASRRPAPIAAWAWPWLRATRSRRPGRGRVRPLPGCASSTRP